MKSTPSRSAGKNSRPAAFRLAHAKRFLAAYKQAWEKRDAELAAHLFTRDVHYWEEPFARPIVGREDVYTHWKKFTHHQDHIHFYVQHFYRDAHMLVAEWTCTFALRPGGERRKLAGVFLADFYGRQVRSFRQYA